MPNETTQLSVDTSSVALKHWSQCADLHISPWCSLPVALHDHITVLDVFAICVSLSYDLYPQNSASARILIVVGVNRWKYQFSIKNTNLWNISYPIWHALLLVVMVAFSKSSTSQASHTSHYKKLVIVVLDFNACYDRRVPIFFDVSQLRSLRTLPNTDLGKHKYCRWMKNPMAYRCTMRIMQKNGPFPTVYIG